MQSAPKRGADVYFTDGSVDNHTSTAVAAFTYKEITAHFRLPDRSPTLQTELHAILRVLQHAEFRQKQVVIHTDSLGYIQALQTTQSRDNISLITTILITAERINERGRTTNLNWIPSHAGIAGTRKLTFQPKMPLSSQASQQTYPQACHNLKTRSK